MDNNKIIEMDKILNKNLFKFIILNVNGLINFLYFYYIYSFTICSYNYLKDKFFKIKKFIKKNYFL